MLMQRSRHSCQVPQGEETVNMQAVHLLLAGIQGGLLPGVHDGGLHASNKAWRLDAAVRLSWYHWSCCLVTPTADCAAGYGLRLITSDSSAS